MNSQIKSSKVLSRIESSKVLSQVDSLELSEFSVKKLKKINTELAHINPITQDIINSPMIKEISNKNSKLYNCELVGVHSSFNIIIQINEFLTK